MINIEGINYIIYNPKPVVDEIYEQHTSVPYINTIPIADNDEGYYSFHHSNLCDTNHAIFLLNQIIDAPRGGCVSIYNRSSLNFSVSYKYGNIDNVNNSGNIRAIYKKFPGYLNKEKALLAVLLIEPFYLKVIADYFWAIRMLELIEISGVGNYINILSGATTMLNYIHGKLRTFREELREEFLSYDIKNKIKIAIDADHLYSSKTPLKTFRKEFLKTFSPDFIIENLEEVVYPKNRPIEVSEGTKYSKEDKIKAFSSFMTSKFLEEESTLIDSTHNNNLLYIKNELLRKKEYFLFPTERILSQLNQRFGLLE